LVRALDRRDRRTAEHSRTVGRYAAETARQLGLSGDRVKRVRLAGILHDIGKIRLADSILNKAGPLSAAEWIEVRRHPEVGAAILAGVEFEDIRQWMLAHHERPDGQGYPLGLSGEQIPLEARILAVADAYEAMTSDRVYRPALAPEDARCELRRGAGTQFDPQIVEAFLERLDRAAA